MSKEIFIENGDHAVLLFHAFTSYSRDFTLISRTLDKAGYTVYAPNLSGHGEEDPNQVIAYTMEDWAKDGQAAVDFLKEKGYEKISVLGLSLGGIVATYVALENKDIHSAGTFSSPTMVRDKTNIKPSFKGWYINKKQEMGLSEEEAKASFDETVQQRLDEVLMGIESFKEKNMVNRYDTIKADFFVGQGGDDEMINPNQAKEFIELLSNANVTFKWYDEAGHVITIGKVGRQVREDLLEFLQDTESK